MIMCCDRWRESEYLPISSNVVDHNVPPGLGAYEKSAAQGLDVSRRRKAFQEKAMQTVKPISRTK